MKIPDTQTLLSLMDDFLISQKAGDITSIWTEGPALVLVGRGFSRVDKTKATGIARTLIDTHLIQFRECPPMPTTCIWWEKQCEHPAPAG